MRYEMDINGVKLNQLQVFYAYRHWTKKITLDPFKQMMDTLHKPPYSQPPDIETGFRVENGVAKQYWRLGDYIIIKDKPERITGIRRLALKAVKAIKMR